MAAARRPKERIVDQLYSGTATISEPEVPSQAVNRPCKHSMSRKVQSGAESGTCNLCSAPCSSCMHRTMGKMRSKSEEFFDETCHVTLADHNSIDERKTSDGSQHTPSEVSNLVSVGSSRDSLCENVESKAIMRPYDVSDASEDHGTQRTISYNCEGSKGAEVHDDSISCVSGASDSNVVGNYCEKDLNCMSVHCNSASVSSFDSEESGRVASLPKLDSSQLPFVRGADTGTNRPKIQSQQLHPRDSKYSPGYMLEISAEVHLKSEPETKNNNEDFPGKAFKCSDDNEEYASIDLSHKCEPPFHVAPGDESEESDVMEHDVKVCDICGDAGREDLLAQCSKCSDGAEHTYCMREMLQKVPKGYWLCEECKLAEDTECQRQGSDAEGKEKTTCGSSMQILGKRHAESVDAATAPKRQAVETDVRSPKFSTPKCISALSQESSFKSLEKGKMRPSSQNYSVNHSGNDSSETLRSPSAGQKQQTSKSLLLKCNSFSTLSSRPKVKLVEDVPQKQKGARECNAREEPARMMGKSKSFKSASFGHLNVGEPKVKMLSSKCSYVQDLKGIKQVTEGSSFERKNVTKLDQSSSTVLTLKAHQKLAPWVEVTFPSANNIRDSKVVQPDGKQSSLSSSDISAAYKGIENAVTSVGAPPNNGVRNSVVEQKSNKVNMKDEPSVCSSSTGRLSDSVDGVLEDVAPQLLDPSNHCEKTREKLIRCSSKVLPYQKGKELGHTADHVSSATSEASASDVSAPRNAIEDENKGCKLKATIEAARKLKPGICARAPQDQLPVTNKSTVVVPLEGSLQGQTTINNMKQITAKSTDAVASLPYTGGVVTRDSSHVSGSLPAFFKISAIPDYEYIWLGDFEVHSSGKPPILCGGIQAHLSTLASPKVFEVVNKFGHNIVFSEVPRLSTWPLQFHYGGPKDDNIALYFFAKDLESYKKNYNVFLERIIQNDLALRASFHGVELLVFPSNQLPENSQRWNTLFFLWGVFRGRSMKASVSLKGTCSASSSTLSLDKIPQNTYFSKHVDDESAGNSMIKDKGCDDDKVSTVDHNSFEINLNSEDQVCRPDASTKNLSSMPTSSKQLHLEMRHSNLPLMQEKQDHHKCHLVEELGSSIKGETVPLTGEGISSLTNLPAGDNEVGLGSFSMKVDVDQVKVGSLMANTGQENQGDLKDKINSWEFNNPKRPYLDLSQEEQSVSINDSQKVTWSEVTSVVVEGRHAAKKLNRGFGATYTGDKCDMAYSSPIEKHCDEICEEKIILEDRATSERCMFPVGSRDGRDLLWGENSAQWKEPLLKDKHQCSNDIIPNLELGLGADTRLPKKETWPFVVGTVDKDKQGKPSTEAREDDLSASLSLSLSFPSASVNSEEIVKPIPKTAQLIPEARHVNTSLLLFRGVPDK